MKKEEKTEAIELQINEIVKQLHQVQDHLHWLTKSLQQMGNIQVQKLILNHPHLENLIYQMERLEIKEVSGTLNVGNNFGLEAFEKQVKKRKGGFSNWLMFEEKDWGTVDHDQTSGKQSSQSSDHQSIFQAKLHSSSIQHSEFSIEKNRRGFKVKING